MAEYIKREDAKNVAAVALYHATHEDNYTPKRLFDALDDIPDADVQPMRWIPIEEKLPQQDEDVLVCAYGSMIRVWCFVGIKHGSLYFEDEDGLWESIDAVSHWMPLPEPPKDGET